MSMAAPEHSCVNGWILNDDDTVSRCPVCVPIPRLQVAHARSTDPAQSHIAAAGVKVSVSEDFVLGCLKDIGQAVLDEELIAYVRSTYPQETHTDSRLRTARAKLVEKGLVRFAAMGRTKRDKPAAMWEAVPS